MQFVIYFLFILIFYIPKSTKKPNLDNCSNIPQNNIKPNIIKIMPINISKYLIKDLYLIMTLLIGLIAIDENKNGIASPNEYTDNKTNPLVIEPYWSVRVNIAPNTGPTHGDQPAAKNTPIKNDVR